jgi:hypothetical protein
LTLWRRRCRSRRKIPSQAVADSWDNWIWLKHRVKKLQFFSGWHLLLWATAVVSVPRNAHADVLVSSVRMICDNSYTLCVTKLCVTGELPYKSCLVWDEVKGEQNWRPKLFFYYSETLNAHGRLWWLIYRLSHWNV